MQSLSLIHRASYILHALLQSRIVIKVVQSVLVCNEKGILKVLIKLSLLLNNCLKLSLYFLHSLIFFRQEIPEHDFFYVDPRSTIRSSSNHVYIIGIRHKDRSLAHVFFVKLENESWLENLDLIEGEIFVLRCLSGKPFVNTTV